MTEGSSKSGTCYKATCLDADDECIVRGELHLPGSQWTESCKSETAAEENECEIKCRENSEPCQSFIPAQLFKDGTQCQVGKGCFNGHCIPFEEIPLENTCANLVVDGDETDVDCGGAFCSRCALGKHCLADGDCATPNICDLSDPVDINGQVGLGLCASQTGTPPGADPTTHPTSSPSTAPPSSAATGFTVASVVLNYCWYLLALILVLNF